MKKILCIHQGWELYGSDRSFITNLEILQCEYPKTQIQIIIPKSGAIVPELLKISKSVELGKIGKVERKEMTSKPLRSVLKILSQSYIAFKQMRGKDLIYINTIAPYSYLLASVFFRSKVILHAREIPPKKIGKLFSWWFRFAGIKVIFNSIATRDSFFFQNREKGVVIPNAVEAIKYIDLKSNDEKINILLIGRINSWKGHFFLVDTLSQLKNETLVGLEFTFLGSTPEGQEYYLEELKQKINGYGLNEKIEIVPFVENPDKFYNSCDYVIVPSVNPEPFGRVAAEAFSVGKPVIGSRHGGIAEIVKHGENGYLFTPSDSRELITIFERLEKNSAEYISQSKNAMSSFQKNYTVESYKAKFTNFINLQ